MRRLLASVTATALAVFGALCVHQPARAQAGQAAQAGLALPGGAPPVLPPLQNWSGGTGAFTLTPSSRIVVDTAQAGALRGDAGTFSADLAGLGVERLPVVTGGAPQPGDIFLTAAGGGPGERFRLSVTPGTLTIAGDGPSGTFYGEQAVEQILKNAPDHASVPAGTDSDSPAQGERGLMLDTARKYWSVTSIEQVIRQLAWMRMNTLHWHLADSEFFRLDLPGYPGLAAPQSYTQADVSAIQDYAARYHVTVRPELDLPAHSTALTAYHPSLRWDCPSMNGIISSGRPDPGFTVDITKPANVAYLDGLVGEVASMFDSPVINVGGDETPYPSLQSQCPELTSYAAAHGYGSTEDVFIAFENHLDSVLAAHGKHMEVWGWWPDVSTGAESLMPNKDILVQAWYGDEDYFTGLGYHVIVSNEYSLLYVVPKYAPGQISHYIPAGSTLYDYTASTSPLMDGLEMAEWGDNAYNMPDAYPLSYLRRPLQLLASVAWGSPKLDSYLDYEVLADQVGSPPGVPEAVDPAARPVTATASSDGTGLDLGSPVRLAGVRLRPASSATADLASLVGATVQGCTDGPDSGCHDLATIQWTPTNDWLTLPVDDPASYRWIRVAGAGSATPALGGLQALAVPDPAVQLSVTAPAAVDGTGVARVAVRDTSGQALSGIDVSLGAHSLLDNTALGTSQAQPVTLSPGQTKTVSFVVSAPATAHPGDYRITATAGYPAADGDPAASGRAYATARTTVPLRDLAQAFDNIGVSDDGDPQPADFDGAQSSFSEQGLARAGVTAGGTLTAGGFTFTLPATLTRTPDNALAHGQVIPLNGGTTPAVGLLATGTYAPAGGLTGTVTVTYTDGSTSSVPVTVPDWSSTAVPGGVTVAANAGTVNGYGRAQVSGTANLYALRVPVDPGKQLASITLPAGPRYIGAKTPLIHVFAIAKATP